MRAVLVILLAARADAVATAVEVGDIMWVYATRCQSIRKSHSVVDMAMREWILAHRHTFSGWLEVVVAVLPVDWLALLTFSLRNLRNYALPALALRHDAGHLVESAIGARCSVLYDVAPHFSCPTTLTCFGSSTLHRAAIGAASKTGC